MIDTAYFREKYPLFEKVAEEACIIAYLNDARRQLLKDTAFINDCIMIDGKNAVPTLEEIDAVDLGGLGRCRI